MPATKDPASSTRVNILEVGRTGYVKRSLAALNTKQQKDVVIVNGKITMGFVPCLLQVL
jgi:hypothetical protein